MLVILRECNKRNSVLSYGNKTYYIVYYYKKTRFDDGSDVLQRYGTALVSRGLQDFTAFRRILFIFFYSQCRNARVRFSESRDYIRRLFSGRHKRRFGNITILLLPSYAYYNTVAVVSTFRKCTMRYHNKHNNYFILHALNITTIYDVCTAWRF